MLNHHFKNKIISTILIIILLVFSNFFLVISDSYIRSVNASSNWTLTSDSDFNKGTLNNVSIIGKGENAELTLDVNQNWIKKQLISEPASRFGHSMAPIWGTDKVLLFGGYSSGSYDTTWLYDMKNNTWVQQFPNNKPSARYHHRLSNIYGTDKVLLFGGFSGGYRDDTWIYDLSDNNWTEVVLSTKPGRRYLQGMAPIFGKDLVVMFGGYYGGNLDDLWVFNLTAGNWTEIFPNTKPSGRYLHSMDLIYGDDKVVLFGGTAGANETWAFDYSDNNWTRKIVQNEPPGRTGHAMASIYNSDKVLIFGGDNSGFFNDTWLYDLSANNWTNISTINKPSARKFPMMSAIHKTDKIVLFGGFITAAINETWEFNYLSSITTGTFISPIYNISGKASYLTINWNETVSNNTSLKCQIRTAENEAELSNKNYIGPDGTTDTSYDSSPMDIWGGHAGDELIQFCVYFDTSTINEILTLEDITITYNYWPETTLISPLNNSIITNNKPEFEWDFDDQDSSQQGAYEVVIDDNYDYSSINYKSGVINSSNKTYAPDYSIDDGIWYWRVRTRDNDGDWGLNSLSNIVIIDGNSPISEIEAPINNSYFSALINISGIAFEIENGTGLNRIEISINQLDNDKYWNGHSWALVKSWQLASGTRSWIYDSSEINWLSGKTYIIQSRAIDNASNIETSTFGNSFLFDNEHPSSSISVPIDNSFLNNLGNISGNAEDDGGADLNYIEIRIHSNNDNKFWDGEAWNKDEYWFKTEGGTNWYFNSSNIKWVSDNYYTIYSRAIDKAINIEPSITKNTFMFDNKPPQDLLIIINENDKYSKSTGVLLSLNANDTGSGVSGLTFSNDNSNWSIWEGFEETKTFDLSKGDGEKSIYIKVKDKAGNIGEIVFDTIILDTTPPENLTVIINKNDKYTSTKSFQLFLQANDKISEPDKMSFSFDSLIWTPWETYNQNRIISSDIPDGNVQIYFRVTDKAGNIAMLSDNIILDSTPPHSLSISINNGVQEINSTNVSLKLSAQDGLSGIHQMAFSNDGVVWSSWEEYKDALIYIIPKGNGLKNIYFRVKDQAGNIAEPVLSSILLNISFSTNGGENGNGKKKDDSKDDNKGIFDNIMVWIAIILIIIIILIITFFVITKKHKKQRNEDMVTGDSITTKPQSQKVISIGDSPPEPELQPQTELHTATPQEPTIQPTVATPTTPTVDKPPTIGQTPTPTLTPQQLETPQLPPAPEQQTVDEVTLPDQATTEQATPTQAQTPTVQLPEAEQSTPKQTQQPTMQQTTVATPQEQPQQPTVQLPEGELEPETTITPQAQPPTRDTQEEAQE